VGDTIQPVGKRPESAEANSTSNDAPQANNNPIPPASEVDDLPF
jgi:hypothetical protein